MLRADAIISFVAFGMGFAVYLRWRPELSKWLWPAGLCWYLPRTLLTLGHNHTPVADGTYDGGPHTRTSWLGLNSPPHAFVWCSTQSAPTAAHGW